MSITVNATVLDALMRATTEWEHLSANMQPTSQQQNRMTYLAQQVSLLKAGCSPAEIRRANIARLVKEAGAETTRVDKMLGYAVSNPVVPRDERNVNYAWGARLAELRQNAEGTQSITYTQETEGGAFVPQAFSDRAYETMKMYDQIFDPMFSNVLETEGGNNMPVPAFDDVAQASILVNENSDQGSGEPGTETPIGNFGSIQLGAYTYRSGLVVMSRELEIDSAFPWGALLERVFAKRHARGIGAALINGTGVSQPTGIIAATLAAGGTAVVSAGSSTNDGVGTASGSVGTQDIAKLYGSINAAYRMNAVFYMSDASYVTLLELLDKYGRPIVNFVNGAPYIYGKRIAICPSMNSIGSAGNNVMLFGSPDYFVQRRATGSSDVRRYTQMYGLPEAFKVAYESWMRVDSNLLAPNPSYVPFAVLQQHS